MILNKLILKVFFSNAIVEHIHFNLFKFFFFNFLFHFKSYFIMGQIISLNKQICNISLSNNEGNWLSWFHCIFSEGFISLTFMTNTWFVSSKWILRANFSGYSSIGAKWFFNRKFVTEFHAWFVLILTLFKKRILNWKFDFAIVNFFLFI
jgi:hypothetical protein